MRRLVAVAVLALVALGASGSLGTSPAGAQDLGGMTAPDAGLPPGVDATVTAPIDTGLMNLGLTDTTASLGMVDASAGMWGLGAGMLGLGAVDALSNTLMAVDARNTVTDDYLQVTQLFEQQNLARAALEAAERARLEAELRRQMAARTRNGRLGSDVPFAELFNDAGARHSVDPRMLAAVARAESGFSDDVVYCRRDSSAGARGLMQFMPGTAAGYGIDPCDPAQAIDGAARMLRGLYEKFGSWDLAFAGYNAGPGAVERFGGIPPYAETQNYVRKVNEYWDEYKARYPDTASGPQETRRGANGDVCIQRAAGIEVACHLAGAVEQMVAHAASEGVTLAGSGWRSYDEQVALRRQNCGTSDYDVYERPSMECSPPTARPGSGGHEIGDSIDFQNCSSPATACFQWLSRNAATYGFYNFPPEPWHWSTTGR